MLLWLVNLGLAAGPESGEAAEEFRKLITTVVLTRIIEAKG